jgi:hypothetical protein
MAVNRLNVALAAVFACAAAFYCWRANIASPLALHGSSTGAYNRLANALLHLHLWVARVPPGLLRAIHNQGELRAIVGRSFPDYALYGRNLYIIWGPAPAVVLLVPLHLFGFEPSDSVIVAAFAIVGVGFALATLRVIIRQVGKVPLWVCILAALAVACSSVVPYLMATPEVYQQAIVGGYCFTMAAIWLAVSAVVDRRASLARVTTMSLCVGLAAASRPPLGVAALVLVPVYLSLRSARSRRGLLVALVVPVVSCLLLLAAYDQARFGNPLAYGTKYQLNSGGHYGGLGYILPGLWSYVITPPRISVLFPFLSIIYPQVSYPLRLPTHYSLVSEETGGLLAMTPITIFIVALPWTWRRRPASLGRLGPLLLVMAVVGVIILLFMCYEFFGTTERYEVDYTTLLLFGALAVWLVLAGKAQARTRWMVRVGGILAVWSCVTGVAVGAQGLQERPDAWRRLVNLSAPISTAVAELAGHPILAEVIATDVVRHAPSYGNLGTEATGFSLPAGWPADLTIVSPGSGEAALVGNVSDGPALPAKASLGAILGGRAYGTYSYWPVAGDEVRIPLHLARGVNRLELLPLVLSRDGGKLAGPESKAASEPVMVVTDLRVAGG